jgi:hypothetical protein
MSNTETMQLDLFEGKILTDEQRLEVQKYIGACDKEVVRKQDENRRVQLLLDESGFKQGIDYVNNFEVFEKTYNHEFGYSYDNTQWESEVNVMRCSGGCQIIYDVIREGKSTISKSFVYREDNKLQCTSITSQYRYYKPSSLLTKLKENNKKILDNLEYIKTKSDILNYTVEKYTKLFPDAKVSIGSDYNRGRNNYSEFPTVKIDFSSGSYFTYRLGYEKDGEYFHKKFDSVIGALNNMDLLNYFNNQKPKS